MTIASRIAHELRDPGRFVASAIDAADTSDILALIERHQVDLVLNAVDPRFVMPVFESALQAVVDYMDMATSLSRPHPQQRFSLTGTKLADEQFARAADWEASGRLALLGMGMDPGLTDPFAAHAARELFDEIDELHVRDGGDMAIEGFAFAPVFSIWTTIEECLNPPVIWEDGSWHTTEPFSGAEAFPFPDGVGPVECVNVEHEEVLFMLRYLDARHVTFKYALGAFEAL
jgi:saccharopine dehydrogenase (NAD+, L-lysine-forming)